MIFAQARLIHSQAVIKLISVKKHLYFIYLYFIYFNSTAKLSKIIKYLFMCRRNSSCGGNNENTSLNSVSAGDDYKEKV